MHASLPGYDSPLFFRGMTTDLFNMQQIFQHREYGFDFQQQPHRILDLGAYGGYAAVYFANRFPNAQILCVEPSPTNFRLLCLNTAPYENVKRIHGAIWHKATRLQLTEQIGGDWGNVFHERNDESTMGVPAYTVTDVINSAGWPGADYVKCDIEGGELEIFSDPNAAHWLSNVSCVSVETHDRFKPGCIDAVEKALPPSLYAHKRSGEFHVFTRLKDSILVSGQEGAEPEEDDSPEVILLIPQTMRLRRFDRVNVLPDQWGFLPIDDETFQLHPRSPGEGRAEIRFHLNLSRQRMFSAQCHLPGRSQGDVEFSVRLIGNTRTAFAESRIVAPGQTLDLRLDLPQREGPYQLALGTEMAPSAPSNGYAWAQWARPCLR